MKIPIDVKVDPQDFHELPESILFIDVPMILVSYEGDNGEIHWAAYTTNKGESFMVERGNRGRM